jgi:uncharacterized protein DUF6348
VPVIWDCAAGVGPADREMLQMAVDIWATSTLPALLEFLKHDGSEATHFNDEEPDGCPGWHVIHGPIFAYGNGNAPDELQNWAHDNNFLSRVGPIAVKSFERDILNGVKLLFGGSKSNKVAEVRINGTRDDAATNLLSQFNWPLSDDPAFGRCFLLFVHPTERRHGA